VAASGCEAFVHVIVFTISGKTIDERNHTKSLINI